MKIRIILLIVIEAIFLSINAQNTTITQHTINWKGVKTWQANQYFQKVLAFSDAEYVNTENHLPYFTKKIEIDDKFNYSVKLINEKYQPLSALEKEFVKNYIHSNQLKINTFLNHSRGKSFYNIEILPFIKKENNYYRLTDFELKINQLNKPQKANANDPILHSFVSNSVLANGNFVKIAVKETGFYKITYQELENMGITPENVRIFGYGGALLEQNFMKPKIDDLPELTIWVEKGNDGVFNAGDYILFYGQGLAKWSYDETKNMFTHTLNHYANEGYYFITSDVGEGKRIEEQTINIPEDATILNVSEFTDYAYHELEDINLGKTGKIFYGEEFFNTFSYDFDFNFPHIVKTNSVQTRLDVAVISSKNSSFSLSLDEQTYNLNVPKKSKSYHVIGKRAYGTYSYTPSQDNLKFTLTYNRPDGISKAYLNYLEVNARREMVMTGSVMFFRNVDNVYTDTYSKYILSNANNNIQIWDITNPQTIKKVPITRNGNTIEFIDSNSSVKQYVAIDPSVSSNFHLTPTVKGAVANQNLHGLPYADFLIITHSNFLSEAQRLAQAHREIDNMTVNVVTAEQVYNEFSSGTHDATAYRWFVKMFYDRALQSGSVENTPKYLLLLGRGSYDNRGIIINSGDNMILTYQAENSLNEIYSYVTDDYFGYLDNDEGVRMTSDLVDLGIGRFPVATQKQAKDVVDKTISYMNNDNYGIWKNQIVFLADDGDASLHVRQSDGIAQLLHEANPIFQIQKIYLDAYQQEISASGQSYPIARQKLHSMINSGCLYIDYMGHAGASGWTNERILTKQDIDNMYNKRLPFFMTATCNFLRFDVKEISGGEYLLLNPSGGGIGSYSAARTVYATENERLNRHFSLKLFEKTDGEFPRLGDAVQYSKTQIGSETNKLSYMLFGDPALRLNYPKNDSIITEKINDVSVSGNEEFTALSVQKIEGAITDNQGNIVADFNGKLEATVYDKQQTITTLNNEQDGSYTYVDRPNVLYSGKVDVTNGKFSLLFMVPRDIRYNMGKGRIIYYAFDPTNERDAMGYYENFNVGGSNPNYEHETEGPQVSLYLNNPNFKSKDKVNETPLFVANISDINGINTSGNGIGHDLRLVIDDNTKTAYTLNHYFQADVNSYTSGTVHFKIPKLPDGKHTLTFHAWDLLNNSTTTTIDFEVVTGLEPVIFNISNYPNPVQSETKFVVNHNRPEVVLEAILDIYDLSGRAIYSQSYNNVENIKWDLKTNNGHKVKAGAYIYKISIKTTNSKFVSKANKIIVIGQ